MPTITDWIQVGLTAVLVIVTIVYVWRTHVISKATEEQADASMKMAEEAREQRIMSSRPVIIQKAVVETETQLRTFSSKDYFSYFEVFNAGNGPAIELEVSILNEEKTTGLQSHRETFLRSGDSAKEFYPEITLEESKSYYLVCEYQSIFSRYLQTWYQTELPFKVSKSSKEGKIYVIAGELEFKEVKENERIDAFSGGSKPK